MLNSAREYSRFAAQEDEGDCANKWWSDEWERCQRGEYPASRESVTLKEKRQWNTDERAEENRKDREGHARDNGFDDDSLRQNIAIVGECPLSRLLKGS